MRLLHLVLAGLLALPMRVSADDTNVDWAAAATQDIRAGHAEMLASHPGPVNDDDPSFMAIAERAYAEALDRASNIDSRAGYNAVLLGYTAHFRDGHFALYGAERGASDPRWTGFIAAWRPNMGYVIADANPAHEILNGASILACDGIPMKQFMDQHVFAFSPHKPDQDSYRVSNAWQLFVDDENPLAPPAQTCRIELPGGEVAQLALTWQPIPDGFHTRAFASARSIGQRQTVLREVQPGVFWISVPHFNPDEAEAARIKETFEQIRLRQTELRNARAIVIDSRGNNGGSSAFANDLAEALWGKDYLLWQHRDASATEHYRVSPGNLSHFENITDLLHKRGQSELVEKWLKPLIEGLRSALAAGDTWYSRAGSLEADTERVPTENPVDAPVYMLSMDSCASACLDLHDLILGLEGTTHIGFPTRSDTNYLEVRQGALPSGHGAYVIPTKVWRGRKRPNNGFYEPAHRYERLDWSDEAVTAWVLNLIEQQTPAP